MTIEKNQNGRGSVSEYRGARQQQQQKINEHTDRSLKNHSTHTHNHIRARAPQNFQFKLRIITNYYELNIS